MIENFTAPVSEFLTELFDFVCFVKDVEKIIAIASGHVLNTGNATGMSEFLELPEVDGTKFSVEIFGINKPKTEWYWMDFETGDIASFKETSVQKFTEHFLGEFLIFNCPVIEDNAAIFFPPDKRSISNDFTLVAENLNSLQPDKQDWHVNSSGSGGGFGNEGSLKVSNPTFNQFMDIPNISLPHFVTNGSIENLLREFGTGNKKTGITNLPESLQGGGSALLPDAIKQLQPEGIESHYQLSKSVQDLHEIIASPHQRVFDFADISSPVIANNYFGVKDMTSGLLPYSKASLPEFFAGNAETGATSIVSFGNDKEVKRQDGLPVYSVYNSKPTGEQKLNKKDGVIVININRSLIDNFTINVKDGKQGIDSMKHLVEETLLDILSTVNVQP